MNLSQLLRYAVSLPLGLAALISTPASANDSVYGGCSGAMSGLDGRATCVPKKTDQIALIDEKLTITQTTKGWDVVALYTLEHTGKAALAVPVGFPVSDPYEPGDEEGSETRDTKPPLPDYRVFVDGKTLDYTLFFPANQGDDKSKKAAEEFGYDAVYLVDVPFEPGQKRVLEHRYSHAASANSIGLHWVNYILRTGANWKGGTIGRIFGQEKNITTYNLARMNMLLHGMKDTEFDIFHGDTLTNDWEMLRELNPARKPSFDAIVANPPFSYRWEPTDAQAEDVRFKSHGLAPKSAADFAFLLHGFQYLSDEGVMAIILPHGVLFRGGAEDRIRTKLLKDGHIDTVIGLPANLFYSTGIPVCTLMLKKCKKASDVLFINAAEHFTKGKKQNLLSPDHIAKIVDTYQHRTEEERYSRRVEMAEIEKNEFNLNISRYISTAVGEAEIDLAATLAKLHTIDAEARAAKAKHNAFLVELGLPELP